MIEKIAFSVAAVEEEHMGNVNEVTIRVLAMVVWRPFYDRKRYYLLLADDICLMDREIMAEIVFLQSGYLF